ncbi:MAG: hypothetical protein KF824_05060 [Fimbriimonadaceae bacterium]|nr:MAG: hypothetical protein KF824_05060 [Fimbriimonadaceae bacterium]
MSHKSPFTDDIYIEWEFLAMSPYREPIPEEELVTRSIALYEACFSNDKWLVHPLDASLVTNLRFGQLATEGDYSGALEICENFLNHPDLSSEVHKIEYITIKNNFHSMQFLVGQVEVSILGFSEFLTDDKIDIVHLRNSILGILRSLQRMKLQTHCF